MSSQPLAQQCASHHADQVSLSYSSAALAPPSYPSRPGSSILIDCHSEGSLTAENHARRWTGKKSTEGYRRQVISIDVLPDDVLLEIFEFYLVEIVEEEGPIVGMKAWQRLVHVCRRWRSAVFGSPRRLDLQLVCTPNTPGRDTLDVWPELPLLIDDIDAQTGNMDNVIALLERSHLVCRIILWNVHLEDISEAMEVPFPELTFLVLYHSDETEAVPLPDSFLGGSAPRLQSLWLDRIPFPGLPKLLSSATHLTDLRLSNIPHSGYFSPEAMVACLSVLTNLEQLSLGFQSPQSLPHRESRPLPKRTALPVLTRFSFRGVGEYLEDLVARLDAPRLDSLQTNFFNDIDFDTPQFTKLISRTPALKAFDKAGVVLADTFAGITLTLKTSVYGKLELNVSSGELVWQVSFLERVCTSSLPLLSTLEVLYVYEDRYPQPVWENNINSTQWLDLLYPFSSAKNLFLSEKIAPLIVPALQELVGGRTTEVLPSLQNVYLEGLQPSGPVQEGVGRFASARQDINHPIAVSRWDRRPGEWPY